MKNLLVVLFVLISVSMVMMFYIIAIPVYFLFFVVAIATNIIERFLTQFRRNKVFIS